MKKDVESVSDDVEKSNRAALNDEYSRREKHNYYSQVDAWRKFLNRKKEKFWYLSIVIIMLLIFPTNSAGVERVFSATSWIKNVRRNRMLDDLLNANLYMKLNARDIDYSLL